MAVLIFSAQLSAEISANNSAVRIQQSVRAQALKMVGLMVASDQLISDGRMETVGAANENFCSTGGRLIKSSLVLRRNNDRSGASDE
jgi:hypothetical protein